MVEDTNDTVEIAKAMQEEAEERLAAIVLNKQTKAAICIQTALRAWRARVMVAALRIRIKIMMEEERLAALKAAEERLHLAEEEERLKSNLVFEWSGPQIFNGGEQVSPKKEERGEALKEELCLTEAFTVMIW